MQNKRKIFFIFLIIFLSFILIFYLNLRRQEKQEIRKKAAEEEKILISLIPSSNDSQNPWLPNSENEIKIKLTNTSQEAVAFRVVGVYFSFDSNVFDLNVNDFHCNTPFSLALGNASKVENNFFQIICFLPGNTYQNNNPYTLNPQQSFDIGSFKLKVKPEVRFQQTQINFLRINIPQEETLSNLGYFSSPSINYYVGTGSPTFSPPTSTPTSPSTPSPINCQKGDLNQDGRISEVDILLVLKYWNPQGNQPLPTFSLCSPDVNNDGKISEIDIFIILNNWQP